MTFLKKKYFVYLLKIIDIFKTKVMQILPENFNNKGVKSSSQVSSYPELALKAALNSKYYKVFRRHHLYTPILEHVEKSLAQKYLNIVIDKYKISHAEIFEIIRPLQYIGNPKRILLKGLDFPVSSTAIRYLKVGLDIKDLYSQNQIEKVVEIGCGYGGQAIILNRLMELKSYTFIDIWQVNLLIRRFIEDCGFDIKYQISTLNELIYQDKNWDLLISNYAFSEIPKNVQKQYLKNIISRSFHGYMIMNSGKYGDKHGQIRNHSQKELLDLIPNARVTSEIPLSYEENYLLNW